MPKIEVNEKTFYALAGKNYRRDELEEILSSAKAELDGCDESAGILKIELNDTNRPDLWSTAGLARQLRTLRTRENPEYEFFSSPTQTRDAGSRRVLVDAGLRSIRPFIAAFAASGGPVDDAMLRDIIQSQEKLCWNFGRRRRSIAMGVYRSQLIDYPVHYRAVDPAETRFTPLGGDREMSLLEIHAEHPKGREFGHIMAGKDRFPFLSDARGEVLSYPPVINSASIGAVEVGDRELFIELTGTDIDSLLLAANIVACDLADLGFRILPVRIEYPYATKYGSEITTPFYFQKPQEVETSFASKLLGGLFSPQEAAACVQAMGSRTRVSGTAIRVYPPAYRNDFLHPVDIVEDIMIGRGMDSFRPVMPSDFTVGRLSAIELYSRRVQSLMVGLGFQEMIFNYLGSLRDFAQRMNTAGDEIVRIANPMSENYEYVRPSILPCLLGAESVSANAVYPHTVFEIGKVAALDPHDTSGTRTANNLGFLTAAADAGYNGVYATLCALLYYLSVEFSIDEIEDPRFIAGRSAAVVVGGDRVGVFGETNPAVLENWGIQMPCSMAELNLDRLCQR